VRYDSRSHVDQLVPQIKMLVANSVEGLSYDKVSVVLVPVVRAIDADSASASSGSYLVTGLEIGGAVILLLVGLGFIYRDKINEMVGRRGVKLPTIWSNN
jgi:type III secretion protein J